MSEENKDGDVTALAKAGATSVVSEKTNWARLHGSWKERIERMLPDQKMIDQFMYCAEAQYGKDKAAYEKCTPVSLLSCMLTCAKYGILPDGRNAYLIPYGNECTLQFDYKGLVHVVIRDGVAKQVYADVVCENDKFSFRNRKVELHEISFPRGEVMGAYCAITLPDGSVQYEVMERDELDTVKSCSRGSSSPSSPWNKFFREMCKKTVFRRATKWLKLSPDVMDAIGSDDANFDFGSRERKPQTLFPSSVHAAELPAPSPSNREAQTPAAEPVVVETAGNTAEKSKAKPLPF